jgi:hypothetical protein
MESNGKHVTLDGRTVLRLADLLGEPGIPASIRSIS